MTVTSLLFPISGRGFREEKGGMWRRKRINHKTSVGHKVFRSIDELQINHVLNGRRNQPLMQPVSQSVSQ